MACVTYRPSTVRSSVPEEVFTVKLAVDVAVPLEVVTVILPVVAPAGTEAVTEVPLLTVKVAVVPLNRTALVAERLVPVIVTESPARPLVGTKLVIDGVFRGAAGVEVPPPPPHATSATTRTNNDVDLTPINRRTGE